MTGFFEAVLLMNQKPTARTLPSNSLTNLSNWFLLVNIFICCFLVICIRTNSWQMDLFWGIKTVFQKRYFKLVLNESVASVVVCLIWASSFYWSEHQSSPNSWM